jgi:hypothetical protein
MKIPIKELLIRSVFLSLWGLSLLFPKTTSDSVKYAIEPMTALLIGSLIAGGAGAAQIGQGIGQRKKAKTELDRLNRSAPDLNAPITTPAEYFQAYKDAYNQDVMNRQLESIRTGLAGTTEALAGAGGRALLGGIGAASQQASRQSQNVADAQIRQQLEALQNLASAQERTRGMQENRLGMREQRYQTQLANAQAGFNAATQNIMSGIGQIGGAGMNLAAGGSTTPGVGGKTNAATGGSTTSIRTSPQFANPTITKVNTSPFDLQGQMPSRYRNMRLDYKKGGSVMKTPGDFSHKNNPIDLMQGGKKIGEATGGEYIFNPKQMSNIKRYVSQGDKSKLHSYVRSLIKKFEG